MATYSRETRVNVPLDDVWAFHLDCGLEAVSPSWLHLEVESVTGPDGASDPDVLEVGARIQASMRPFGVGPRQRWISEVRDRGKTRDEAYFVDEMLDGPFPEWRHTHRFIADGEDTIVADRVRYRLPGWKLGELVSPLGGLGLAPIFRARHRRTRELLEG